MRLEYHRQHRFTSCVLAAALLLVLGPSLLAQESAGTTLLSVIIRDPADRPVADARVSLRPQDGTKTLTAQTDEQGGCRFANLRPGVYVPRIEKNGYAASELSPVSLMIGENRELRFTLDVAPSKPDVSQPAASHPATAPEFFDQPHFTVSGVTDTTSVGGHGSDAVARTRESLAKDTVTLGSITASPSPVKATEASLRETVERNPASFAANLNFGKVLAQDGKPREALPYLEHAAKLSLDQSQHDQAEVHRLLASVQEKLGHSLEAVREYQRAAELNPSETYLFDWGSELLLHHAPEPALEVFSKGNQLFPQSARVLMGLGAAWFASGSFDRAVQSICQASDLNPADPAPYQFLAKMQSTQTLTSNELVEKLHRFATLHPESAAANYYYAVGLWKQRKNPQDPALIAQVDSLLHTAIRLDPSLGVAYLQLGILHSEQKDFPQAISNYQHALQTEPRFSDLQIEEAHYRLAQAYREIGETAKAKSELQLYEQISKESAQQAERQRREIGQFVYTLRDQSLNLQH